MSILHRIRPNVQNRTLFTSMDRAVQSLRAFLDDLNYGAQSARECCFFVREHGTTAGLVELGVLDAEDLDGATEAFVSGFDPVHESSPQWGDATRWVADPAPTDAEALEYAALDGRFDVHGAPLDPPPDLDDDRDYAEWACWSAGLDEGRNPWSYEEAELSEARISAR